MMADGVGRGSVKNQTMHMIVNSHVFENGQPSLKPTMPTVITTLAAIHFFRFWITEERPFRFIHRTNLAALLADATHQPLGQHSAQGCRDQVRCGSHVE